ncbi:uncharacterized protein LOC124945457 [Impatiens glandulifera]|uniref:uncharacterized protein LOC124945457 n=1 Tax=Impatiens glandulifera TaxID=253017 RepID=UPI001FB17F1E|nr:uncharacterized protein LOC124945457 [Impatiens glandulifera]
MNQYAVQMNSHGTTYEDVRSFDRREKETVVCPKPRRFPLVNSTVNDPVRSFRWHHSYVPDPCESRVGADLLDILLPKGGGGGYGYGLDQVSSSPPFFCGSPPSRVSNPLIQDARFGDEKFSPISPQTIPIPSGLSSPSPTPSSRKGGCIRANFGNNPSVRVEGFDSLDRDRRNCSIPALA